MNMMKNTSLVPHPWLKPILPILFLLLSSLGYGIELKKGDTVPTFNLNLLDSPEGPPINLRKLLKSNKPVILSFYATWCVPCLVEIPILQEIKKTNALDKMVLVNNSRLSIQSVTKREWDKIIKMGMADD